MSSRNLMLQAIRQNKPATVSLPEYDRFSDQEIDLVSQFCRVIQEIGGMTVETKDGELAVMILELFPSHDRIASTTPGYAGNVSLGDIKDPHELADLDLYICEGAFGVAENGAVWLDESQLVHRAAPFLTQNLAIVLYQKNIVGNMHEAYERVRVNETGFGVFVAGPSKTADIEQSLVIGAHGPRSLTVLLK